jgi:hypothetical protein
MAEEEAQQSAGISPGEEEKKVFNNASNYATTGQ